MGIRYRAVSCYICSYKKEFFTLLMLNVTLFNVTLLMFLRKLSAGDFGVSLLSSGNDGPKLAIKTNVEF